MDSPVILLKKITEAGEGLRLAALFFESLPGIGLRRSTHHQGPISSPK
jgi:hypothetical protein